MGYGYFKDPRTFSSIGGHDVKRRRAFYREGSHEPWRGAPAVSRPARHAHSTLNALLHVRGGRERERERERGDVQGYLAHKEPRHP